MTKKVERLRAPVGLPRRTPVAVASASRVCALSLLWASLASAGAPPSGISLNSETRDYRSVSVGVDLDGDGAIRDLLGNGVLPGDEGLFGTRVEIHQGPGSSVQVEPTARLFFTLPGAVSELNDSVVATISADGRSLNVQGSGSCSSEAPASGTSFVNGRHEIAFRVGAPGTFRVTGTITASPLREALVPPDELDVGFFLTGTGGASVVVDNGAGFSGDASFDESGAFAPGGLGSLQLLVSCNMTSNRFEGGGGGPLKEASWEFNLDVALDETPDQCLGAVLTWVGGREGAFADPASWEPPQVPVFEEGGRCDTARVQGGRNVTIDLAAAARSADPLAASGPRAVVVKTGRLVVDHSEGFHTTGGRLELDSLSPVLGERSLEIGNNASMLLQDEVVVARHVAVGTAGAGEVDVSGDNGFFETGGRLGLGAGGDGRLVVRDGATVISAETVLGETAGQGSALVQGTASLWQTGNLAVGEASDASIIVDAGGKLQSDEGFIDHALPEGARARVIVQGKDPSGNPSKWELTSLIMSSRGVLEVADGGVVEIAEELLLTGLSGDCARPTHCVILRDGKLSAASVSLVEGELRVEPAGRLDVTTTVRVEDPAHEGALLDLRGPARAPQLTAKNLFVGRQGANAGRVDLQAGAKANLSGAFVVGGEAGSDGYLALLGDASSGEPTLLTATEPEDFDSVVGAPSAAPAGEHLEPTGVLELREARMELSGLAHDLAIQRQGLLESVDGTLSIQAPGRLKNLGVVRGGLVLEGSYLQAPEGTYELGSILVVPGPEQARRLSPLAAAGFPPRAVRAKPMLPPVRPLVVTGDATLAGRLLLQFGNGVAPRQGDQFEVLDVAGTVTGTFAEVSIRGLVPGSFAFDPSLVGGKLTLTSTTDAVALPAVSVKAKPKLKETAKQGKIKLKRTGDTSAPLVVSYTVGGTAQSGVDYEALPGTIEFPAKKKSATIRVRPIADGLLEGPETLELTLVPGDSYAPGIVSQVAVELLSKDE